MAQTSGSRYLCDVVSYLFKNTFMTNTKSKCCNADTYMEDELLSMESREYAVFLACGKCKKPCSTSPSCTTCYDKGYYSVMSGGAIALPDFIGDKPFSIPATIEHKPCPKCKKPNNTIVQEVWPEGSKPNIEEKAKCEDLDEAYIYGFKKAQEMCAKLVQEFFDEGEQIISQEDVDLLREKILNQNP